MKKFLRMGMALLISALFLVICVGCTAQHTPSTETDDGFHITDYEVTMSVSDRREIQTIERISVRFASGRSGFIRDFDLTGGVRYRELSATRDGKELPVSCHLDDGSLLSFYLGKEGNYLEAGRVYVYEISYVMLVPALKGGYLPLDVLGYDFFSGIDAFSATLHLPAAPAEYRLYSGIAGTQGNGAGAQADCTGSTVTVTAVGLAAHRGITLDLRFADGVLKAPPADLTPLWAVLAGVLLLGILAAIKLLICRQPLLTTTVNLTAPNGMDPLRMGVLIDGTADAEDLGTLVFYFASKGYLTIDLSEGEDDPILIKSQVPLPDDAPAHQRVFYEGLFRSGNSVRVSSLSQKFYTVADATKGAARASAGETYEKMGFGFFTGLAAVILLGGTAWITGLLTVGHFYHFWLPFVLTALGYFISFALSVSAQHRAPKWGKRRTLAARLGGVALGCLPALGAFLVLSPAWAPISSALLVFAASIAGMVGGFLPVRTKKYNEELGHILGFRDFILYTERDKIEVMLRENPALYYEILPYAQVLGVTDAWTEKFAGLDMPRPSYVRSADGMLLDAILWSHMFRTLNAGMAHTFVSRPSNSGGGGGGSFGGGSAGGGFGGGGGRSF